MIKIELFKKILPECESPKELHEILRIYEATRAGRLIHPQKMLLENAHKYLGFGSVNKSCGECIGTAIKRVLSYLNQQKPVAKKPTKKKVEKNESASDEIPTNYMALKSYAEKKLGKKYPKGTKSSTIRKELGIEK